MKKNTNKMSLIVFTAMIVSAQLIFSGCGSQPSGSQPVKTTPSIGQSDEAGETGKAEKAGEAGEADKADEAGETDKADEAGKAGEADEAGKAGEADEAGKAGKADEADEAGKAKETVISSEKAETESDVKSKAEASETEPLDKQAAEGSEAEPLDSQTEKSLKPDADENEEILPLKYSLDEYERVYPGLAWEEKEYIGSTELISISTKGYEKLQEALDAMNEANKKSTDEAFRSQATELASPDFNEYQRELLPFSGTTRLDVKRADSRVLSLSQSNDSWLGGAHPYFYSRGFTYDSKSGRLLDLKDVASDYDALYEAVLKKLSEYEHSDGFFDEWEETLHDGFYGSGDLPNFCLTVDGFEIWFNQYEIGPYVIGPVTLDFITEEDRGLLKPEYDPGSGEGGIPWPETPENSGRSSIFAQELCREEGYYKDSVDNEYNYSFVLPFIDGVNSDYIDEVNREIGEIKMQYVDQALDEMAENLSLTTSLADYSIENYKGITSVLITIPMDSDIINYYCWNIRADGSKADNEDLLEAFGLTPQEFTDKAREVLSEEMGPATNDVEADAELREELNQLREKTLSEENCNADMPIFISEDRFLSFIAGIYTPAGAGYYEGLYRIPGTEHRKDGLTRLTLNPLSMDNIRKSEDCYFLRDQDGENEYRFDENTVLIKGLPCYDDGCGAMEWMERYLEHPAFDNGDEEDNYRLSGFAPGDIMTILVDKDRHIDVFQDISYWD